MRVLPPYDKNKSKEENERLFLSDLAAQASEWGAAPVTSEDVAVLTVSRVYDKWAAYMHANQDKRKDAHNAIVARKKQEVKAIPGQIRLEAFFGSASGASSAPGNIGGGSSSGANAGGAGSAGVGGDSGHGSGQQAVIMLLALQQQQAQQQAQLKALLQQALDSAEDRRLRDANEDWIIDTNPMAAVVKQFRNGAPPEVVPTLSRMRNIGSKLLRSHPIPKKAIAMATDGDCVYHTGAHQAAHLGITTRGVVWTANSGPAMRMAIYAFIGRKQSRSALERCLPRRTRCGFGRRWNPRQRR